MTDKLIPVCGLRQENERLKEAVRWYAECSFFDPYEIRGVSFDGHDEADEIRRQAWLDMLDVAGVDSAAEALGRRDGVD